MTTTLPINHTPRNATTYWVCLTPLGLFQCQQTDAGWTASSVADNVTAIYADNLPHQAAALAVLWQVILQSDQPLIVVNHDCLPDHPTPLKQVIGQLSHTTEALTLECFAPYYADSYSVHDLGTALTRLTQFQPLFPGAANGPTFAYQRLVNAAGRVLAEVGDVKVVQQFQQFTAACSVFDQASESIPDDVLSELV